MKLYEILYVSNLAPGTPVTVVSAIMAQARRYNQDNGVTGLTMFDGARFAQLLEGARDLVFDLVEHIRTDARHINMEILHYAPLAERRFLRFGMGYVPAEQEDALTLLAAKDGEAALQHFLGLIPVLDLDH
ncbi:MAG: BLUF domain-containing protein [Pseudomonadota bacterium]